MMKNLLLLTVAVTTITLAGVCSAADQNVADEAAARGAIKNKPANVEKFRDLALGMFIHWSVDSQLGSVISHSLVGADDAYARRFFTELPGSFHPRKYDPAEWAALAKLCGFKYAVFTTKHHSGFCMFHTKTTDFSIEHTPYRRDIVREYAEAFRAAGLGMGFYFSPDDFWVLHRQGKRIARIVPEVLPSNNPELMQHNLAQIRELYGNYGAVDFLFIDGQPDGIRELAWQLQPDTLVTRGAMVTPEQRLPDKALPAAWEACYTLGTQWQFKPTNEKYKSGTELIEMLIETRAKGGNLLLNVGPEPSGVIPAEQERIIRELGLWLFINGEAIYQVRPWHVTREGDIWLVRSATAPKTVYAFLTKIPAADWKFGARRQFVLRSVRAGAGTRISVLGHDGKVLEYSPKVDPTPRFAQKGAGLHLDIMKAQRIYNMSIGPYSWPNPLVVKLVGVEPATPERRAP
jgi:alpha-L-fucosidase